MERRMRKGSVGLYIYRLGRVIGTKKGGRAVIKGSAGPLSSATEKEKEERKDLCHCFFTCRMR